MLSKSGFKSGFITLALVAGTVATGFGGGLYAQTQEPDMSIVQEVDLTAFTNAYEQVEGIRHEYLPRAEQTSSTEEKTRLLHEAHERMRAAIEDNGLTVEQYSHTSMAVSRDPELKQEIIRMLEERRS